MSAPYSEVAVVIPCYNAGAFLVRALESALAQTFAGVRVYVIDDGSTDATPEILRCYSNRICAVRQQRRGPGATRNRGIAMSRSRYVAFLDADDFWLPEKLARQVAVLESDRRVGLVCSDLEESREGKHVGSFWSTRHVPQTGAHFAHLLTNCFVSTPTVIVRRECLEQIGVFNESLPVCEDFNLWLRIASRWQIATVHEPLTIRNTREEGLSHTASPRKKFIYGIKALEHARDVCAELCPREIEALQAEIARRCYGFGSFLLETGAVDEAREYFLRAQRARPGHWRALTKYGLSYLPGALHKSLTAVRRSAADGD
jgi:glycosyltransferase involved in cell wall biosynthesis